MAIRGIDFDFGKEPADTFTRDQHPDLRADFVMALPSAAARSHPRSDAADRPNGRINPPFNIKEWWDGKLEGDARWKYGTPPQGNANFAWVQHMLHNPSRHSAAATDLAPNGSMALLLANGSMSSNSSGEGDSRRALIEADLVECMVALPGQLFTNTQIPACIWFLTKNKAKRSRPGAAALRDRRGETLFIDARKLGFMKDRVLRDFAPADIGKIAGTFRAWRASPNSTYADAAGFSKSANLPEINSHGHILTPGRYVGAEDIEDDGEPFEEKMARLAADLGCQFAESAMLETAIKTNLKGLGYGF
jgi:type I restriction enzyme M protein